MALEVISDELHRLRNGEVFSYSDLNSVNEAAAINHSIQTAGKEIMLRMAVASDQAFTVALIEGVTVSAGTPVTTIFNRKRTSPLKTTAVMLDVVTFTGGTTIFSDRRGTAAAPAAPIYYESLPRDAFEWILAPNTTYIFQVTNNGAATANISTQLNLFE